MPAVQAKRRVAIVLAVAIVVAVAVFQYFRVGAHGPDQRHRATVAALKGIGLTLDDYKQRTGRFPSADEGLKALYPNQGSVVIDAWGQQIVYLATSQRAGKPFDLYSIGENGIDEHGSGDDIDYWTIEK